MQQLSLEQKKFLVETTKQYQAGMRGSPAEEYLESRKLGPAIEQYRLGYVTDARPGHEMYRGMLAIPYLRSSAVGARSVATIRFRCIEKGCDHARHPGAKYATVAGDTPRLFNTAVLDQTDDWVAICEGELDAISASLAGVPAVGIPGVESWKPEFREQFLGYETVYILADNDDTGQGLKFASEVAKKLGNARIIPCTKGHDINSELIEFGPNHIREKIK